MYDKYSDVLEYFMESFFFLEKDALKIFKSIYENLDKEDLNRLIENISELSFFCDSESILWKYRILYNENKEKIEKIDDYIKGAKSINFNEEIKLIDKEEKKLNNLIYWEENQINNYKSALSTIKSKLSYYKNKDLQGEEIKSLKNLAQKLITELDNIEKDNNINIKIFLKNELSNFINSDNPIKNNFENLKLKINIFINESRKNKGKKIDILNLPNREIKNEDFMKNFKLNEIIFSLNILKILYK